MKQPETANATGLQDSEEWVGRGRAGRTYPVRGGEGPFGKRFKEVPDESVETEMIGRFFPR